MHSYLQVYNKLLTINAGTSRMLCTHIWKCINAGTSRMVLKIPEGRRAHLPDACACRTLPCGRARAGDLQLPAVVVLAPGEGPDVHLSLEMYYCGHF